MGTILTHEQVNPWAVMGANLAGSLIGDMIQRSRQAEENKKLNALFSEVQNSMAAPQAQNFIAQSQVMPEGYDTNPWAAALHQSYTPMTQYNLATADVNPLVQAQQANNIPSVQAMRNAVLQNLGTKRFGMLDPAKVEQFMTPYYQSAQQAQQEALRKEYADKLMNAQDSAERRAAAWGGAGVGVLPWDVVNAANGEYRYDNMSAADKAANLFRNMQFGESQRQFDTQTGLTREKMAQDNAQFYSNQEYMIGRDAQNQSNLDRDYGLREREFESGIDQQKWLRGETERTNDIKNLNDQETALVQQIQRYKDIIDSTQDVNTKDLYSKLILNNEALIAQIAQDRAALSRGQRAAIQTSDVNPFPQKNPQHAMDWEGNNTANTPAAAKQNTKNNTIQVNTKKGKLGKFVKDWGNMFGNGVRVAASSGYGMRGKRHHDGIDLAVAGGSDIRVPSNLGGSFTVEEVKTNDPWKGYGNYVVLSKEHNGHKIKLKFAHLQNDSINVKKGQEVNIGDVIGKVGNTGYTGNSRQGFGNWYEGKDYGNHLHIEAIYDKDKIDPADLMQKIDDDTVTLERSDGEQVTKGQIRLMGGDYFNDQQELVKQGFLPIQKYKYMRPSYMTGNINFPKYSVF